MYSFFDEDIYYMGHEKAKHVFLIISFDETHGEFFFLFGLPNGQTALHPRCDPISATSGSRMSGSCGTRLNGCRSTRNMPSCRWFPPWWRRMERLCRTAHPSWKRWRNASLSEVSILQGCRNLSQSCWKSLEMNGVAGCGLLGQRFFRLFEQCDLNPSWLIIWDSTWLYYPIYWGLSESMTGKSY